MKKVSYSNREFNRLLRKKYTCKKCKATISEAFRDQHDTECAGKAGKSPMNEGRKSKCTDIFDKAFRMWGSFGHGKRR